jgi:UDP-N-acetylglucosamine--N-acetylmuramyl-(pentapeptide) pyrophosphoryl-undecaprenol N-acetylglucosamine transferase
MILTGNPVRQDLIDIESKRVAAIEYFNLDATKKTLLVLGGSLGAVNQLIEKNWKHSKPKCSGNMAMGKLYFEV